MEINFSYNVSVFTDSKYFGFYIDDYDDIFRWLVQLEIYFRELSNMVFTHAKFSNQINEIESN